MTPTSETNGASASTGAAHAAMGSLRNWLASMHGAVPLAQRALLVEALREAHDALLDPKEDLETLLAVDQAWWPLARNLTRRYRRDTSVAKPDAARFHAQMGEIGRLFGEIYAKFAGFMLAHAGADALSGEPLRQITARALSHLGKHARWLICNREQPDAKLWRRLHELYLLAIREGFDARPQVLYQDEEMVPTCGQLWLRAVMLGTLNTGSLSPRQVDRAEQWLEDWCSSISAESSYDEARHLYCVDVAGEAGPVRITPGLKMVRPIFLRTTHLYSDIVAARLHYLEQSMASSLGLYVSNPLREYLDLLDQMQRIWASAPAHIQGRSSTRQDAPAGTLAVVVQGITDILALRDDASSKSVRRAQWTVREYSERGLGLQGPMDGDTAPITQQLIAVRWRDAPTWHLGVIVRAMNLQTLNARQAGVRLLASEAIVLTLSEMFEAGAEAKHLGDTPPPARLAFFLAGNERSAQADSLLCPTGTLVPKMRLTFATSKNEFIIWINRVIEGTRDWQRIGFQVLEKRPLGAIPALDAAPAMLVSHLPEIPGLDHSPGQDSTPVPVSYSSPGMFANLQLCADDKADENPKADDKREKTTADFLAVLREPHPRLAAAIELMWGNIECEKYMDEIILDDRGSRQGFQEPVMSALLALHARHAREFPFRGESDI
ncbi:MAG: hypothetical protein ACKVQK_24760 [Burkholderiales bacterium]